MRARLIGMVVALLAVTLGAVAIISTRVAHFELRKLEIHRVIPAPPGQPPKIMILRQLDDTRPTRSLDRSFFFIFAGAAVFGVLMALLVARWISVPVEKLTAAARKMEGGDLTVRVAPAGGAELEELAHSFNAMAAAVDRNEEVRRRMVTDVAHELRAPLTNLRCELASIQDGLTAATTERIASLHDEVMHLSALVDDLQDLSLADAGKLEINAQRLNVGSVVRRVPTRGAEITFHGSDDVYVHADPRRVLQIVTNLVSNAIVASTPRGADVSSAQPRDSAASAAHERTGRPLPTEIRIDWEVSEHEVVIRVSDRGCGIAEKDLPHIFERFYRVDPSRSRATGGAGLGLSIVQQLVLAHGGRVWAESTPGAGTTVAFTLPS